MDGDVTIFLCNLFEVYATLLVQFISYCRIWTLQATICGHWPYLPLPRSVTLSSSQLPFKSCRQELDCRKWHQFPFCIGFVLGNDASCSLALLLEEKVVFCSHDLPSWGRAVTDPNPVRTVGKSKPCKSIGQTVSLRKSSLSFLHGLSYWGRERIQSLLTLIISIKDYKGLSSDQEALMQVPSLPYSPSPDSPGLLAACCSIPGEAEHSTHCSPLLWPLWCHTFVGWQQQKQHREFPKGWGLLNPFRKPTRYFMGGSLLVSG